MFPTRRLAAAEQWHRQGREGGEADPDPARLRMRSADERADRLDADVGGEDEEAGGDQLLRTTLGGGRAEPRPVNSQTTTNPASASIRLSAPKPISAIEPAAIPAPSAIPNSTKCQAIPPQASRRARSLELGALAGEERSAWR